MGKWKPSPDPIRKGSNTPSPEAPTYETDGSVIRGGITLPVIKRVKLDDDVPGYAKGGMVHVPKSKAAMRGKARC